MAKKFNHAFDIAFSIESDNPGDEVTAEELIDGLERRLRHLRANGDEIIEACGKPFNSYENETGEKVPQ